MNKHKHDLIPPYVFMLVIKAKVQIDRIVLFCIFSAVFVLCKINICFNYQVLEIGSCQQVNKSRVTGSVGLWLMGWWLVGWLVSR